MKRISYLSVLVLLFLTYFSTNRAYAWPFMGDNDAKIKEVIQEYKQFEKKNNYSDEMFKIVKKAVKGEGAKNFTLRMANMRLKYYKAVRDEDQSEIQEVSNEAESLLKGDHPLFRQQIQEKEVKDFLLALKKARYNEKHGTNWLFLIITVLICGVLGVVLLALLRIPVYIGGPVGLIAGITLYYTCIISIFYKTAITFSSLPPVPLVS